MLFFSHVLMSTRALFSFIYTSWHKMLCIWYILSWYNSDTTVRTGFCFHISAVRRYHTGTLFPGTRRRRRGSLLLLKPATKEPRFRIVIKYSRTAHVGQREHPGALTGPSPCSCSEPPGSRTGWRPGPAAPAPREQTGGARGSSGCSPPPWSPSRTRSVHLGSLAPPGDPNKSSFKKSDTQPCTLEAPLRTRCFTRSGRRRETQKKKNGTRVKCWFLPLRQSLLLSLFHFILSFLKLWLLFALDIVGLSSYFLQYPTFYSTLLPALGSCNRNTGYVGPCRTNLSGTTGDTPPLVVG